MSEGPKQRHALLPLLFSIAVLALAPTITRAGPINTDVALTPPKGGSIFRLQYVYSESSGRGDVRHVNASVSRGTYVYGLKENLSFFLTVPYVDRQTDVVKPQLGRFEMSTSGLADLTFLAKYRFWQDDRRPGETLRWAAIGGLNLRSGDSEFTSDSYDPIIGTVFTWQRDRGWLDADLIYQFNTGRGEFRHDVLRYDVAYSYRVAPVLFEPGNAWELDAVAELNGRYMTDGSHEVFLSPGIQFITTRWIFETSLQLPVIQDVNGPETEYRLVIGFRFQW
ncbi:MAG: transporter [Planctomycetes bacterium]|nr:transporter [Planctomycetota bacterium]